MQLTTAGNLEAVCGISLLDAERNVSVQLTHQTVAQVAGSYVFTFFTGQRAVVYDEVHGNSRLGDFLERDGNRVVQIAAESISDVDIRDTGNSNDRTDACLSNLYFFQSVKFIQFADLYFFLLGQIVVVDQHNVLVHADRSVFNFADTDTSNVFVVVDGTDQKLCASFRIAGRSRDVFQNGLEQRCHILRGVVQIEYGMTQLCGCVQERTVKLLVGCVEIHQKLKHFVDDFVRACLRAVDFVDADDNGKIQLKCFFQHEFGLRHSALECVYNQNNAVYHFQNSLNLAAEVRMAWGVDDVDFRSFVVNCCIFGKNGDSTLTLDIVRVHDTFLNLLIGTENATLFQKLVYQCSFTMIDMGDDGNVSYIFSRCFHFFIPLPMG